MIPLISSESRKGELFILSSALLWGFFPIVTVLTYQNLPSLVSLTWSMIFSAFFFFGFMAYRNKWKELLNPQFLKYSILIAIFITLFYVLEFTGLTMSTPGNLAIIGLLEVFTTFLFFNVLRREFIPREHVIGGLLMVFGAGIILIRDFSSINLGDILFFAAICTTPFGNMYQQRAREIASSESIMFLRVIFSIPVLFLLVYVLGINAPFANIKESILLLIINGVLLLGLSKIFWLEAIHRISVSKGIALGTLAPFLTLILAWL